MRYIVKPVKCGDCSIIDFDNHEMMLVDCGSDNRAGNVCSSDFAYSAIKNEISRGALTHLMVSHFHKDHFNGILQIPSSYRFRETYIPYSICKPADNGHIVSSQAARLLSVASKASWGFRLSNAIIDLLEKVLSISDKVVTVKCGDILSIGGTNVNVLWPDVYGSTTNGGFDYGILPVKQIGVIQSNFGDIRGQYWINDNFNNTFLNCLVNFFKCSIFQYIYRWHISTDCNFITIAFLQFLNTLTVIYPKSTDSCANNFFPAIPGMSTYMNSS